MPNPYAAKTHRSVAQREPERDHLTRRLRAIGATPDEIEALRAGWDELDESWTAADRAALVRSTDSELARRLAEVRTEYMVGTTEGGDDETRREEALGNARRIVGQSVQSLLAWVGADPLRAWAVLEAEAETSTPRRTLLSRLSPVAGSAR